VTNLSPEFCRKVRDARRAAKLGQVELAAEIGCKQSALSMFEQGQPTKLNDEVVEKLAKKFGISLAASPAAPAVPAAAPQSAIKGFCPNPHCPTNHAYQVEDKMFFHPDRQAADPVGGRFCAFCGEVLIRHCPNCGAMVHEGAVCSLCGEQYIQSPSQNL